MKSGLPLLSLSLLAATALGTGILSGCSAGAADDGTSESEVVNGSSLDDAFAKTVLSGGCEVVADGQRTTTTGEGGKCPTKLGDVLDLLQALPEGTDCDVNLLDCAKFRSYVVDEKGDQPNAGGHRFVVAVGGDFTAKLYIATVSRGSNVSETGVEAMGFSEKLNAFVYYKEEGGKWVRKGDGSQVKSHAKGAEPAFECIACHTTGGPQMKELHDSWANWHSTWFQMPDPGGQDATFKRLFDNKTIADGLEPIIIQSMNLHSNGRVERAKKEQQLSGVLEQLLCEVGEPSIIGVHSKSRERVGKVSTFSSMLPTSVVLNSLWSPPATGTGQELGLDEALNVRLPSLGSLEQSIDPAAYAAAIEKNGQTIAGKPGDAMFAMTSPQKSFADIDAIQELVRQKLIDDDIVADILMTDFTVSSFSAVRCGLAKTLPATWANADELRTEWAKKLASSDARGAKGLAARLKDTNDLAKHTEKLETYLKACVARSQSEQAAYTEDLVKIVSQRRTEFASEYAPLIESEWLIPQDKLASKAHQIRLSGTTCEIEKQSEKFVGEN